MDEEHKPDESDSMRTSDAPGPGNGVDDPRPGTALFELRAIALTGDDALDFAQSQFTADVGSLSPHLWTPSAWCDAKGRVLALMLLAIDGDAVHLALPDALADDLVRRLRLYQIGRNVTISDAGPIDPADALGWPLSFDGTRRLTPGRPATEPDWAAWLVEDLRHEIAWILPATSARYLPQALGLEQLGGLSYRKGCWPGQEVVARVRYRGRVTRTVQAFRGLGPAPEPAATIAVEDAEGTVLYALADPDAAEGHMGLAVIPLER